jgi:hypothetical protein
MWRPRTAAIGGSLLLLACVSSGVERQQLADGSWQLTCQLSMDRCVQEVEKTCRDKRYAIIQGSSDTRLRDAPPFATEYHTSRLQFVCGDKAAQPPGAAGGATAAPKRICGAGDTRSCVGAGACAGGQTCLPDGSGYGRCDCGTTAAGSADGGAAGASAPDGGPAK